MADLHRKINALAAQKAGLQADDKALAVEGEPARHAVLAQAQSRQAELRLALGEAQREAERLQARPELLARLRAEGEGLHAASARCSRSAVSGQWAAAEQRRWQNTERRTGYQAFLVRWRLAHVPAEYEVAIEVALGGHVQDVVVESWSEAEAAVADLKAGERGWGHFLPLDTVHSARVSRRPTI